MQATDVIIIGGGMVGLTLALALEDSGLRVAVIESQLPDATLADIPENRVSAINLASQTLLTRLGAWPDTVSRLGPYTHMQVWEADSSANIEFSANLVHQAHLGHIVENKVLQLSLLERARLSPHIELHMPAKAHTISVSEQGAFVLLENGIPLTGRIVVGADGARSWLRAQLKPNMVQWDYDHHALVATLRITEPHQQTARQIFRGDDIIAFLPLADPYQCSLVWSCPPQQAKQRLALSEQDFNNALAHAFDFRLGPCQVLGPRMTIPLTARYSQQFCGARWALIGDAAHTVHPLAGQGVNLGLQDAAALAQTLSQLHQQGKDIGTHAHLRAFERWRKAEAMTLLAAMEGLKRLFGHSHPLLRGLRGLGLSATNKITPLKRQLAEHALGTAGLQPELSKLSPQPRLAKATT
ncbi:FAD-dependent oxidoreductase [Oceanisphaera avium]|uniref:FAD-dependent 2-octaprenylphenol hydroxylase n=1 Tax=Oceanisphaera avium TaxID=1903694 RepID=A0A1Y0CVM5_9GAMM|nr:FAD-dependent oxidoreductase [Oceanisphaera avium]ART78957.1 FAD-dependent 2-octaprenylphenol hydroxylase [Oceanisphaera avium]